MSHESAYNRALLAARRRFFQEEGVLNLEQLYREFAAMLIRIDAEVASGKLNADRAEALKRSIMAAMQRYADRLSDLLIRSTQQAAEFSAGAHAEGLSRASQAAGVAISHNFAAVPTRALENMMMRRGLDLPGGGLAGTYRTLINRKIEHIAPEIDRILTSGIARGISARDLTSELATAMAREDPQLLRVMRNLGPRGGRTAEAIAAGVEIPDVQMQRARSLLFDSRRIATSEINQAYDASDKVAAAESPVVDVLQWEVSGRHAGLPSSPDVCDVAAEADLQGLGPGRYHKATVPSLLHPHCACRTRKILLDPSEWGKEPRPVPPVRLVSDEEMAGMLGLDPETRLGTIKSQAKMLNQRLQAAHRAAQEVAVAA